MQIQWEYVGATVSGGSLIQGLNKLGEDGWQVVNIETRPNDTFVICKRPKNIQTVPELPGFAGKAGRA